MAAEAVTAEQQETQDGQNVEDKEAMQYWGYLVKPDKCGTDKLNRLLAGIARYIATNFEPNKDCSDLTPSQLAAFYRAVGGSYDILFVDTPLSSIAFIYKSLGCLHSIQPAKGDDGYQHPTLPSLKPRGFVTWQTVQLLLGPEEHVPFLQRAVNQFDIVDSETGEPFPKVLPKEAFPDKPNQEMLDWYEQVSNHLRLEAEAPPQPEPLRTSLSTSDFSADESGDEKNAAAKYFSDPTYRKERPAIVRGGSRGNGHSPRQVSKQVMDKVRHFWHPQSHPRRRSVPGRLADEDEYEDITPTSLHPQYVPRRKPSRHREKSPDLVTESDSDSIQVVRRPSATRRTSGSQSQDRNRDRERESPGSKHSSLKGSPELRHHRSHDLPTSPREYFPVQYENDIGRRHSTQYPASEPGGFTPSTEPSFASRVAKMQASRVAPHLGPEERGSYNGRPTVRYSRRSIDPIQERPRYSRSRPSQERVVDDDYRRSQSYDRNLDRTKGHRYMEGASGRRYPQ